MMPSWNARRAGLDLFSPAGKSSYERAPAYFRYLQQAVAADDGHAFRGALGALISRCPERVNEAYRWLATLRTVGPSIQEAAKWVFKAFSTEWGPTPVEHEVLIGTFRALLPPYKGASITLFRGDELRNFSFGKIGPFWTPSEAKAADYMDRKAPGTSVLLKVTAPGSAVWCGWRSEEPDGEFMVDTKGLRNIEIVDLKEGSPGSPNPWDDYMRDIKRRRLSDQ